MFQRKAVVMAVASLLASSGFAVAADSSELKSAGLTLQPVVTADDAAAPQAPLMMGLDKIGAAKPLSDLGINIYGFIESGYTYNHRHDHSNSFGLILPGPFNHEYGNHYMLNQLDLRFERIVDSKKWDIGGLVEVMYGSDAARIHSSGLGYNGSDGTDNNTPTDANAVNNLHPIWQFDIPQAYIDVNAPLGNGLKVRIGKFATLLGYETIDPRTNAFYSHSYLFSMIPFTQTGILGFYQINDQWSVIAGITRGWDQTLEDGGPDGGTCAIDGLGQILWTPNKQWSVALNWSTGPENFNDTSHYRTAIDPIITWHATDKLTLALEGLYVYDGGRNGDKATGGTVSHAYGDTWGFAGYASYVINDYVTANLRLEKAHTYVAGLDGFAFTPNSGSQIGPFANGVPTLNMYEATLGVTITPFPKDPIGSNLSIRPEVRYDCSEDHIYENGTTHTFKDQLTFAADVIFKF